MSDAQSRPIARLAAISRQLHPASHFASKSPDDIVVLSVARTPICKAKRGAFKDTTPDILLAAAFRGAIERAGIRPEDVGDIRVGNVLPANGAVFARLAQFQAGIPYTVPLAAVNRQCSSGVQAVADIAAAIRAGHIEVGIAAGVESMSSTAMGESMPPFSHEATLACPLAADCLVPMGITSETVADKYGISRAQQDAFAARSHALAAKAQREGKFAAEIVPVRLADGVVVSADDGIREGTSPEGLAKLRSGAGLARARAGASLSARGLLRTRAGVCEEVVWRLTARPCLATGFRPALCATRTRVRARPRVCAYRPAFKEGGSTTAGNSSQVSDGAAAIVLASRRAAERLGLSSRIMGTLRSYAVAGVPPSEMGVGPAFAIPAALAKAGLGTADVGVYELNEAFASQALYCSAKLNLDPARVNPNGGAIALGHPLGCTGARQVATLLHELQRSGQRYGVVSMCIGTGMGAAAVFERA